MATAAGVSARGIPRVVTGALHRNLSLLVLMFVVAHVLTTVLDTYTPIGLTAAFVPFSSSYRGFWLGLGAIAFDLLFAVTVTSLLRDRMSYRAWRAVHWLSYASWPVALWHGLGTGTDTRVPWLLALDALCGASVLGVAGWRLTRAHRGPARLTLISAAVLLPLVTIVFVAVGPLQPGWARRAGTPVTLLGTHQATPGQANGSASEPASKTAAFTGQVHEATGPASGQVTITVNGRISGSAARSITVVLHGIPDGAGIAMSSGSVLLGATGQDPAREGPVTHLNGHQLTATLRGSATQSESARLYLVISGTRASGRLSISPGGGP
ncbi:MAG TPA: ferric reductase-like transmembrane domain-containing protein [Streptosporangiaceae bacterium]|nr:ferric reductase-like transmembrane domain-containing protein [Streptosporangiaceae bacterium]